MELRSGGSSTVGGEEEEEEGGEEGSGGLRVHQEPTSASSIFLFYETDDAQRGVLIQ